MTTPTVTIGFTARERFNLAAKSLKAIYRHTHIPFNLIVIDCNIPSKYLEQMKEVLDGKNNFKIIHTDNYLRASQARNLVLKNTEDDYIAFIENDCIVSDDWLSRLINACEESSAGVAIPLLFDGPTWHKNIHHDRKLGSIKTRQENNKTFYEFIPDFDIKNRYKIKKRQRVWSIEMHAMLFRRNVFDKIGLFDETIVSREPADVSLALFAANILAIFEPTSQVNFYNPPPVYKDELSFYHFIWDLKQGVKTHDYLAAKWNLVNVPGSVDFIHGQHHRTSNLRWQLLKVKRAFRLIRKILSRKNS